MAISFALSEIVALSAESFFYGIYAVLFCLSLKVLLKKRKFIPASKAFIVLAFVFGVLISWHVITDAVRLVFAFKFSQVPAGGADLYYFNAAATLSIVKTSIYLVTTVLFDFFILYRCWIVWDHNYLIVLLPALAFLADIGTGIASIIQLSEVSLSSDSVFLAKQERVTKSFFSATLATNGLCTLLIAYRVWTRQRAMRDSRAAFNLTKESAIMAESGAIYSVNLIIVVSTYARQNNAFNVFLDMATPIIGVAFALIIIRINAHINDAATQISMKRMNDADESGRGSMIKDDHPPVADNHV
ncbi:hypothetical protein BV25DRAFT_1920929 [Artomyces pyxidatus]|uniref:Uncharacterized protein n=1 Tax=Artomyces pyxidatus TaxID=48021 RepID=A0ACB8SJ69_9AGAM|nr:hypothetical protein BV25DRAFT_1920929 [Artomyces pyxidatus]